MFQSRIWSLRFGIPSLYLVIRYVNIESTIPLSRKEVYTEALLGMHSLFNGIPRVRNTKF